MVNSQNYVLLDAGDFQKLEQVGPYRIARPSPQAVWKKTLSEKDWSNVDAHFTRHSGGDGSWDIRNKKLKGLSWTIDQAGIRFVIKLTDFGHLGIFPEQEKNWLQLQEIVKAQTAKGKEFQVLNLFAYTGGSTLACAIAGAKAVHIDASKTSVAWGRENAEAAKAAELPVRWIVEDVKKFVGREMKRGSKYHGIILDPPSYGRGNKGETWKIEEDLPVLLTQLREILASDFKFVLLSAHSTGYTPVALENLLRQHMHVDGAKYQSEEMLVPVHGTQTWLPSGASSLLHRA